MTTLVAHGKSFRAPTPPVLWNEVLCFHGHKGGVPPDLLDFRRLKVKVFEVRAFNEISQFPRGCGGVLK